MVITRSSQLPLETDQVVRSSEGGRPILAIRKALGWSRPVFARLCAISERQLAEIEKKRIVSPATLRRLVELKRIVEALAEVLDKKSIGDWLLQPNEAFSGLKPLEVIERGETDRIWRMIYFLKSGVAS